MAFMNARKRNKTFTYVIIGFISVGLLATTLPMGISSISAYLQNTPSTASNNALNDFSAGMNLIQQGKDTEAKKKFELAVTGFEEQLKSNPNDIQVMGDLATSYFYAENADKAIEWAKKALEIEPNYTTVRRNYAIYLFYGKNDPVQALQQLDMIKEGDVNYDSAQQLKAEFNAALAAPPQNTGTSTPGSQGAGSQTTPNK